MGETVAFWLWRIDNKAKVGGCLDGLQHNFTHYFRNNFFVTTSGVFDTSTLAHLVDVLDTERVLFSVDSDPEILSDGTDWLRGIDPGTNPSLTCDVLQKIAYQNAEKLFWP